MFCLRNDWNFYNKEHYVNTYSKDEWNLGSLSPGLRALSFTTKSANNLELPLIQACSAPITTACNGA